MCKIFQEEPIVIKGAYRFKLKHIANAFHDNGFIKTKWDENDMCDGLSAMFESIYIYRNGSATNDNFNDIIKYNEIDCRVIWEIVEYLRLKHK